MKKETEESYKLDANSSMLRSKGFALFCVTAEGDIECTFHTSNLNLVESIGLKSYINNFKGGDENEE